jgi:uncharacterized protein (TIGR02996 family)
MLPPGHEAFLRAICDRPDDDAPRLVYADWLEEHGDAERARFIRLQIALRASGEPDPLRERECEELFQSNGRRWFAELPGPDALWAKVRVAQQRGSLSTWIEVRPDLGDWDRGFPATVHVQENSRHFLTHVDEIAERVPVYRLRLEDLGDADGLVRTLSGMPFLTRIRDLMVTSSVLRDDAAVFLACSPYATGLRSVSLTAEWLGDKTGQAFAESPFVGQLEMLHLVRNTFSEEVRAALRRRFGHLVHC